MSDHPYTSLEDKAFWAPAVARRHVLDVTDLWQAPFAITPRTRIVTFGSCFAQHFGQAVKAHGYSWYNAEPAPPQMAEEDAKAFNYGVFSARTGNIYTCTLLEQWVDWALGHRTAPEVHWERDGRIYDPFRPAIEPDGFASVEEMLTSRAATIEAFRRCLDDAGLLVFTLGLTESWHDAEGGFEYPMCPGVIAGTFDAETHVFENQGFLRIRQALVETIKKVRTHRGGQLPRILLTVSPVPLTATMSGQHVLVATMASKSILRAVADDVAARLPKVSYFPSYEIINAAPFRGMFFEPNMRNVNAHGVRHVMSQFFGVLPDAPASDVSDPTETTPATDDPEANDDLACEEELLGAFGPRP